MSNDLISRNKALKIIENVKCNDSITKNYGTLLDIAEAIRKLPTSYDVDKVAWRLMCESINCHIMTDRAIEIVKAGERDD